MILSQRNEKRIVEQMTENLPEPDAKKAKLTTPAYNDPLMSFMVACGVPLMALQDSIPHLVPALPITGTNTGQFGLLMALGYMWREYEKMRKKP